MSRDDDRRFEKIANDCREANIPFPEKLVEQFERVAKQLNKDWGRPPAAEYLQDLIFPSRPGRRGFPPEVAEEILALKTLHEERYTNLFQTVWDPFESMYKDSSGDKKKQPDHPERADSQPNRPSIYGTRKGTTAPPVTPAAQQKYSAMIAQFLPESVRHQLAQLRIARAQSLPSVAVSAPNSELEELLLDAERLLEEDHFNAGTAILEQITMLFPEESPFAYLRLMEIYHLIQRPDDYEWVNQRLCEQFDCDKLEWITQREAFRTRLDSLAESFLIKMRRQ